MTEPYFKVNDDAVVKVTHMPEIGENIYKTEVVITRDIFKECYKKWIESDMESEEKEGMTDINLVIKIPEEMYQAIKESSMYISGRRNGKTIDHTLFNAVKKGTPLPEHYGKLIDVDQINTLDIVVLNEYGGQFIRKSDIESIQPIIESDESDGDI